MDWLADPASWVAFLTLLLLEIVLGVDNIVFISILAGKLPGEQQKKARFIGLALAMITRVLLLFSLSWLIRLNAPLFSIFGDKPAPRFGVGPATFAKGLVSGRDLILILGGLFLLAKSTHEIHQKLEGEEHGGRPRVAPSMRSVITQILLLDIVFSLDSVITAVGMVDDLSIMISAVIAAILFMMAFAGWISNFVNRHPTVKVLALSFLLLIGATLIAEGFDQHIPRGYIYFAMAFSVFVELINLNLRTPSSEPVKLHEPMRP